MKWLWLLSIIISLQSHAEIFVCKDDKNKTIYQDEPCKNQTLRTLQKAPEPSLEDQLIAQDRLDQLKAVSQQRALTAEAERIEQEKRELELEKLALEKQKIELLEKQALAEQNRYPVYVQPRYPHYGRLWPNKYNDSKFNKKYRLRPDRAVP